MEPLRGSRVLLALLLAAWLSGYLVQAAGGGGVGVYEYRVSVAANGPQAPALVNVSVDGFLVPARLYLVLLPPSTAEVSVECEFIPLALEPLPGGPPRAPPPAGPHGVEPPASSPPPARLPESCAEVLGPYRGPVESLILILRVYPVVYEGSVVVYGEARATVKAYYTHTASRTAVPAWLLAAVSNPGDALEWYEPLASEGYAILLGDPSFKELVLPLAMLRAAQGYTVSIYDLGYVVSAYPADNVQDSIREFARDLREKGYTHLLIVGDAELVPPAYFYMEDSLDYEPAYKATDLYYSFLDGDWDPDDDGRLLETIDTDSDGKPEKIVEPLPDLVPDMLVGRIPASDAGELEAMLSGVLEWETRGPPHAPSMLLAAAILNYANEDGKGYAKTDAAAVHYWISTNVLSRQTIGSPVVYYRLYESEGLSPSNYPHDAALNFQSFAAELGWGYTYLASSSHGDMYGQYRKIWARDDGDGIPESNEMDWRLYIYSGSLPSLPGPLVAHLAACLTGYFDNAYYDSLAEELMEAGAAAVVASTRVSYYQVGWTAPGGRYDQELEYLFWNHLIAGDHASVGEALYASKQEYLARFASYMIYADLKDVLEYVLFGDPALRRFVDPSLTPSLEIKTDGLFVAVTVTRMGTPLEGARVTLLDTNGSIVDSGYTNSEGRVVLAAPSPGLYHVYAYAGPRVPLAHSAVEVTGGGGGGGGAFRVIVAAPPIARPGGVASVLVLFECNGSLVLPDEYTVHALPDNALVWMGVEETSLGPVVMVNVSLAREGSVAVLAWGSCGGLAANAAGQVYFSDYATPEDVSALAEAVKALVQRAAANVTAAVTESQAEIMERLAALLDALASLNESQRELLDAIADARGELAGLVLAVNESIATLLTREAGLVKAALDDLNATLVAVAGRLAIVDTKLGVVLADLSEVIQGIEALRDGQLELKTILGDVRVRLSDLDARLAGVEEGLLRLNTSIGEILVVLNTHSSALARIEGELNGTSGIVGVIHTTLEELAPRIQAIEGTVVYVNTTLGLVKADLATLLNRSATVLGIVRDGERRLLLVETILGNVTVALEDLTEGQVRLLDELSEVSEVVEYLNGTALPQVAAKLDAVLVEVRNGTSQVLLRLNATGDSILLRLGETRDALTRAVEGVGEECKGGARTTTVAAASAAALAALAALAVGRLR